jgi:hypothetical protein
MLNRRKLIFNFITYFSFLFFLTGFELVAFISPSLKQQTQLNFEESFQRTQTLLKLGDLTPESTSYLNKIVENEVQGFLGYHGDSIDYLIYQDIIRFIIEEIVGIPVRADFHFLAPPLDPMIKIQTKAQLAPIFDAKKNKALTLQEVTFPLNFTLWDNLDRLGLNTLEHYIKNESVKSLGYQRRLKAFFERLGMKEKDIAPLFETAKQALKSTKGVILQVFDTSKSPYDFAKKIAYPSYPNGFIAVNKTVDEYFMDDFALPPYPHEIRLLLNTQETLNPTNSLRIMRYTPEISSATLTNYQKTLQKKIKTLSYNKAKKNSYQKELKTVWRMR